MLIRLSVLIPWCTLRQVPVEVEIVSSCALSTGNKHIQTEYSHRLKLPSSDSIAVCSKDFWEE